MGDVLSPPLLFDHPAIYKTSWQRIVGHHFSNFSPKKLKKTRRNMTNSTNSKNINTRYPALDPTANKYLSGSGWEISVVVLLFCFPSSCFVLFMFVYMCFDCKCKSLKQVGEHITNNNTNKQKRNIQTQRNTETTEIQYIQPSTRPRINISQVPAGRFMFFFLCVLSVVCVYLRFVMFCCLFLSVVFLFSPSCFKLLHLQSKNNTYKHIKQNITTRRKTEQHKIAEISQPEPERYLFAVGSSAGYPVDSLQKVGKVGKVEKRLLPTHRTKSLTIKGNPLLWKESFPLL